MNQNRNNKPTVIYICTLLLLAVLSVLAYYSSRSPYIKKFRYQGFGITMPGNYAIHGIDVSHYQSGINWQDVKQMEFNHIKIGFALLKATESDDKVDINYINNWYEAKQMDIPVGAYHFFVAGTNGKAQAQNYLDIVSLQANDLPPVLDVEDASEATAKELIPEIQDWLDTVEKTYHAKPIIYTNSDFYESYLKGKFEDYPLWIANYNNDSIPDISRNWIIWQHSQKGHVNGIEGYVDFNVFNGDSSAFRNLLIK